MHAMSSRWNALIKKSILVLWRAGGSAGSAGGPVDLCGKVVGTVGSLGGGECESWGEPSSAGLCPARGRAVLFEAALSGSLTVPGECCRRTCVCVSAGVIDFRGVCGPCVCGSAL